MFQRKVDVDMLNAVKSMIADVSSVSPSSEQRAYNNFYFALLTLLKVKTYSKASKKSISASMCLARPNYTPFITFGVVSTVNQLVFFVNKILKALENGQELRAVSLKRLIKSGIKACSLNSNKLESREHY